MDEWYEKPAEFRRKLSGFIEREFLTQRNVFGLQSCVPTYITGDTMFFQWSKIISDFLRSFLQRGSFSTWLRAKLTPVVSVSFILSVAALGTLMSVVLYL